MNFFKKYKYDLIFVLIIITFAILFVSLRDKFGILSDRGIFEQFIRNFGIFAPLAIIGAIIMEVVVAPLPGFIPAISSGFIFGAFLGSIYAYIGNILGSVLVFWLARKFGRLLLEKFFGRGKLDKYEKLIFRRENWLLLFYAFPIFPIDIISGVLGLSSIGFKKFFIAISIGFIVHVLILNIFGDYLARLYFMI
ncbi:VTT domain-containing protein [Patescibacteria group bacterium]|nr:VTT domain-containing protein [Patescibacteria group bacterium]